MLSEYYHDHTVRAPNDEGWSCAYDGPDLSSLQGANALVRRLATYWKLRGEARTFSTYFAGIDTKDHHPVYGVRDVSAEVALQPPITYRELPVVGPAPRQRVKALILATLRDYPHINYDKLMRQRRNKQGQRPRAEFAARTACIVAVRKEFNFDNEQLARIFGVDRTSVLHALGQRSSGQLKRAALDCVRTTGVSV